MMAKVFFTLADFSFKSINEITPPIYHGADTIEINYVKSGTGKIVINNESYNIGPNCYAVIPEFVSFSLIPNNELKIYSIYLLVDRKTGYKEYVPMLKNYYVGEDKYNLSILFDDLNAYEKCSAVE